MRYACLSAIAVAVHFASASLVSGGDAASTAPSYFVETVVATTTAQALAQSCPTLSLNPVTVASGTDDVLARLTADGLDPTQSGAWQEDANRQMQEMQTAFVAKHRLSEPNEDLVCAAGLAEIAEGSEIGRYLVEVPSD
jgi:hypothetical protein